MKKCECPSCGASLTIQNENRDFAYCEFCGAKIQLDDIRTSHRIIDEAKIKQADYDAMIRLKELEMEQKEREEAQKKNQFKIIVSIILGIISLVCMGIGFSDSGSIGLALVGEVAAVMLMYMWLFSIGKNRR